MFLVGLYCTILSVLCSLVITCWERADHLALLCVMLPCVFVTFPYGVLGQVWYLEIISWRFGYRPKYQPETPLSAREL